MKKSTILLIISFVYILSCAQQPSVQDKTTEVPPGTVDYPSLTGLPVIRQAASMLDVASNEFVLFYYRPDGVYTSWNLWLWPYGGSGSVYHFTGVTNGVAYYKAAQSLFFNMTVRTLGLIVRTDSWQKDPGSDQFWNIDNGNKFAVYSGDSKLYSAGSNSLMIYSAEFYESPLGTYYIRVKLSAKYGLCDTADPCGFTVSGGLNVYDAINFQNLSKPDDRYRNFTDDILLRFSGAINYNATNILTHTVFGGSIKLDLTKIPKPAPDLDPSVVSNLPEPVLDNHQDWIDLYWAAWKFVYEKITAGDTGHGFEPLYIDEGFNECIYQWDSCFMVSYAIYGRDVFPVMATLDNFYNHQESSGYICRCYFESTGLATGANDINPPLFAWMEWRYYLVSGDSSRIASVLPVLTNYYKWIKNNAQSSYVSGLYYITDFGSGMDNSPRESYIQKGAWIDISAQQALSALYISRLAEAAGNTGIQTNFMNEYTALSNLINLTLWNTNYNSYYDKKQDQTWHIRNTIASYWPMIAELPTPAMVQAMENYHLKNPAEFYRKHLFPTLAANDSLYSAAGHYWRGGVWAPTDFAVIKGLALYDYPFAFEAATNHIGNMSQVYHNFDPLTYTYKMPTINEPNIPRNGDGYNQIWEAYSADFSAPATRWDATLLVRQKFCGWSGAGPVALLIENVLGFELNAPANTITWRINLLERHGIKRIKLGNNLITLIASARTLSGDAFTVSGSAQSDFHLVIYNFNNPVPVYDQTVTAGTNILLNIIP